MEQKLRERLQQVKEEVRWGAEEAVGKSGSPLPSSPSPSASEASGRLVAHGPVSQVCPCAAFFGLSRLYDACSPRLRRGEERVKTCPAERQR
jgi:hypothetical protein